MTHEAGMRPCHDFDADHRIAAMRESLVIRVGGYERLWAGATGS